jgi:Putative  PD-(D/E)XK family member, (DUF4420)
VIESNIWSELENQNAAGGDFRRRIHEESVADLYLIVHKPSNTRGLLIDADLIGVDLGELPTGRGIELRWISRPSGGQAVELVLSQPAFADLFDALITDVATAAAAGSNQQEVALRVAGRVRRWQTFLRESSAGLSDERQRGLFGELYFLRRLLIGSVPALAAVEAWVGPSAAPQDFGFGEIAVEVKTSSAKQHQVLRIASERQLDTTALTNLAVFHLSVDGREGTGQTLPQLVAELRTDLTDIAAAGVYEDRLFDAGYVDVHSDAYRTGYTVREANIFMVTEGFPRLVEADCPPGVGDLVYSIAVSAIAQYSIDMTVLLPLIKGATGA